jgi:hypothetical protein
MKISHMPIKKGFQVRLMSPLGRYPASTFSAESAALVISPEICFSIVRVPKEDWSFSEVDILSALEIPLYGSILLAGEPGTPYHYPYPSSYSVLLETETLQDIDDECILECKSFLVEKIRTTEPYLSGPFHKPPCEGGLKYDLVPWNSSADSDRLTLFQNLQTANPVILRGLNCLLKARMAFQHHELGEAACIYLWVALDAAHSLILQRLRDKGISNPTSKDAAQYFEKISGYETEWEKFFEDDYENRIRAIHPDNRFGAEVIPQFRADDFYELNDELIPLFHFIVSGFPQ